MDDPSDRHSRALGCLSALVEEQLASSRTRPFAALRWEQLSDCGISVADHESVCKALLGGFPASDACFVVRSRWQSG
jgi:hypothetical protein